MREVVGREILYSERCEDLKDLLQTKISIEELSIEAQVSQFAKITTKMRSEPGERRKIRDSINPHTITLQYLSFTKSKD